MHWLFLVRNDQFPPWPLRLSGLQVLGCLVLPKQLAEFNSETVCEDRGSDSPPANLTLASLEYPSSFRKSSRPYPALPQEGHLPQGAGRPRHVFPPVFS